MPQLDLLREVSIVGGERRRLGQLAAMAPLGFRVAAAGGKGGEEEQQVAGGLLILQGGPGKRGSGGGGRGGARPWRQCFHCGARKKERGRETDGWVPLSGIFPFLFFLNFQQACDI